MHGLARAGRLGGMATLVIHGGAGRIDAARRDVYRAGLEAALDAGFGVLDRGGSALDAVMAAVSCMEDNPAAFNAGTGSALTSDGRVECDAAIMDDGGRAGAVACVTRIKNPVQLARQVLEQGAHVLFVGPGAETLTEHHVENSSLITDGALASWQRWREANGAPEGSATCGAVALDDHGHLAAATSTGGVLGQHPGRVGDAPIPGAGTWADARVAVSCTGRGEAFLTTTAARMLAVDLEAGVLPSHAVQERLDAVRAAHGQGGLIAVQRDGTVLFGFDTTEMAWGWRRRTGGDALQGAWDVGAAPTVTVVP